MNINKNFILASLYMLISIVFFYFSFQLDMGTINRIGPGYFSMLVSSIVFLISIPLFIRSVFTKEVDRITIDISAILKVYAAIFVITLSITGFVYLNVKPFGLLFGILIAVFIISKENKFKLFFTLSTISYVLFSILLKMNIVFVPKYMYSWML